MSDMFPDPAVCSWLDSLPDALVLIDTDGRLEWANEVAVRLLGWSLEDRMGLSVLDLVHPDDLHFALMSLESVQGKDVGTPIEIRLRCADGWKLVEAIGANRTADDGGTGSVVLTLRDLTDRRRWEIGHGDGAALRAVLHNASSLLMLVDDDGKVSTVSASITRLLGLDPEKVEGSPLHSLVRLADTAELHRAVSVCRSAAGSSGVGAMARPHPRVTVEVALMAGDGTPVPFELCLVDMSGDPVLSGMVVSGHSLTKLRLAQKALADLALKDPLTRLPNRTAADDRLEDLLLRPAPVDAAFVDLDGFKELNDSFGHLAGDRMLCVVADRLTSAVRKRDLVARYGGDEFVVVAAGLDAGVLAVRLELAFREPVNLDSHMVAISASVGMARSHPGEAARDLLVRADRAMYSVKSARRSMSPPGFRAGPMPWLWGYGEGDCRSWPVRITTPMSSAAGDRTGS